MIAHSSFCNESVVISYGIVDAKIQKKPQFPNKIADFFIVKLFLTFFLIKDFGYKAKM